MDGDIGTWISSIPKVTRYWFFSFFILPLTTRLGLINPANLVLVPNSVISGFQIWRLVTSLLWHPVNFNWLMMLFFLYSYSRLLEEGYYLGRPAEFLFMLLFNSICIDIVGLFFELYIMSPALVFSVLYVWCQINKDSIARFWFGIQVKAMYFPWVLFLFFFILGANWPILLLGILVGHLYFFIMYKYPQDFGGNTLLNVPQFLYNWLPNERTMGGFGSAPQRRNDGNQRGDRGGHNWGQGRNLWE
jgi:derlin-1